MQMVKIFLIDDHRVFRQGLSELLKKNGNNEIVGEASNGREALEKLRECKPDVIFLDISMPELNGIDACPMIRKIVPHARIIILSMYDTSKYICSALSRGVSGYLLKDIDACELKTAVETVMNGNIYLSQRINQQVIKDYMDIAHENKFASLIDTLTVREKEILQLVAEGHSGKEIADRLNISYKTVEHHRYKIMSKLSCHNVAQMIRIAIKEGIITA